jgi:hypothetical protein
VAAQEGVDGGLCRGRQLVGFWGCWPHAEIVVTMLGGGDFDNLVYRPRMKRGARLFLMQVVNVMLLQLCRLVFRVVFGRHPCCSSLRVVLGTGCISFSLGSC